MLAGCNISRTSSASAGVVANNSSVSVPSAGMRCPDWLEIVTPAPPGTITFPTSSSKMAVPYRSTLRIVSTDAWLGDTPAELTMYFTTPCLLASSIAASMESRSDRSTSVGSTSKPTLFNSSAAQRAFSNRLSPAITFRPAAIRRTMALPISPAPTHKTTSLIVIEIFSIP